MAALRLRATVLCIAGALSTHFAAPCYAMPVTQQTQQPAASGAAIRHIGAIKSINGTAITLTPDSGPDVNVSVQPATRLLRIAPGQKDLKSAMAIQLQDLKVGDRILVGGKPSDDNSSVLATTIVVMTHSDLEARHQQELQDWQKRGVDGPVTAVDAAAGKVTITSRTKPIVIHVSNATVIRRYAPESVKFEDAKPGTLAEIHPGDQVRARGECSADGTELTAEEIVSGTFRNIAGTVNSVDASSSTVNVHDLFAKKTAVVKITADSQLRQLPPEMAQRIAMRLKGTAAGAASGASSASAGNGGSSRPAGAAPGMSGVGQRFGGPPDLQQILSRMPAVPLTDVHKGDAVIILCTEGAADTGTVITLLTGVEPILQAAPNASGASILTPWSLGAPTGDVGGP